MWYSHKQEGGFFVLEFSKLSAPSLKELFIQQLQGMILTGRLSVGAKLPPERELARQMQVSRAVVNGGVTELAQQGFLEVRPRQGTFVADYRRKGNLRTLIAIMEYAGGVLGNDEVRSILEVRRALEHLAVQRAIAQASDESMARLGEIVQALGQAQTHAEAAETAFLFHTPLAGKGKSGKPYIENLLSKLLRKDRLPGKAVSAFPVLLTVPSLQKQKVHQSDSRKNQHENMKNPFPVPFSAHREVYAFSIPLYAIRREICQAIWSAILMASDMVKLSRFTDWSMSGGVT